MSLAVFAFVIVGNHAVSTATLDKLASAKPDVPNDPIFDWYYDRGYAACRIVVGDNGTIRITEGPRFRLEAITLVGFPPSYARLLSSKIGEFYSPRHQSDDMTLLWRMRGEVGEMTSQFEVDRDPDLVRVTFTWKP